MIWLLILAFWFGGAVATGPLTYKVWGQDCDNKQWLVAAIAGAIWPALIGEIVIGLIWPAATSAPSEEDPS